MVCNVYIYINQVNVSIDTRSYTGCTLLHRNNLFWQRTRIYLLLEAQHKNSFSFKCITAKLGGISGDFIYFNIHFS
jgi:hypothetical protein